MIRIRTLLAGLVALMLAFAPVAGFAMSKPCQSLHQTASSDSKSSADMTGGGMADCPCHGAMSDCGTMPACQASAGCVSQCTSAPCANVVGDISSSSPGHDKLIFEAATLGHSLTLEPPAPPPRA